jgi:hypothetical protein
MKQIGLAIAAAAAGIGLAVSAASAGPAPTATIGTDAGPVHKTGGIYLDFGGPRYYGGYGGYYDRPYYRSYGYGGRRYYSRGYGYGRYGHSRRWAQERFEHPLGRR